MTPHALSGWRFVIGPDLDSFYLSLFLVVKEYGKPFGAILDDLQNLFLLETDLM